MAFRPVTSSRSPRVVIVGAGMAGIAAAQRLQRLAPSRFQLTMLEASDRIGGRIRSSEFQGERVEFGATWIHGIEGSPIFKLATRIGAMDGGDQPWEGQGGFLHGELVRMEDGLDVDENIVGPTVDLFNDLLDEIKDVENGGASPDESVGNFLRNGLDKFLVDQRRAAKSATRGCHSPWNDENSSIQADGVFKSKEYLERTVTGADSLSELDMVGYQEYKEFGGDHRTIGKGYSTVLRELSSVLLDKTIQFGKKVEKIVWNQNTNSSFPVSVHCQDGSIDQADHVIITVSLGVLKQCTLPPSLNNKVTVEDGEEEAHVVNADDDAVAGGGLFVPPLPVWKLDPIAKLGYGVVNKVFIGIEPANGGVHLPLRFIFTSGDEKKARAAGEAPAWLRKTSSIYPINRKSHVLVTWFAGREALLSELQTDEDMVKGITDTLKKFRFPQGPCKGLARSKWGTDPLFRGSYSYVKRGSTCDDMDLLAEPLPRSRDDANGTEHRPLQLLFAGEATDRQYYSTVHGAYLSGIREADRLLQHYQLI